MGTSLSYFFAAPAVELEVVPYRPDMQQGYQESSGQGYIAEELRLLALFNQIASLEIELEDVIARANLDPQLATWNPLSVY